MTKAELIEKIAKSRELPPDVTKKCVQQIVDLAFGELGAYFARAKVTRSHAPRFTFPGFGTFSKKKRSARKGVNPRTLEPMTIDASFTIDFRPGVELRRALNGEAPRACDAPRGRDELDALAELDEMDEDENPRRRLRSRDEVELDELDLDQISGSLFGAALELPAPPLQRVKAARAAKRRTGS